METDADFFASELLKKQEVPKLNNKYVERAKKWFSTDIKTGRLEPTL